MALTRSVTQLFTFERCTKDFEKENGSYGAIVMFCCLYELR